MSNLLKANYYKLIKSRYFYILMAISAGLALFSIVFFYLYGDTVQESLVQEGIDMQLLITAEAIFLGGVSLSQNVGILMILGISLFIGTEFSQNTIRNKISVGFSRTKVYLSNFIFSVVVALALYLAYQAVVFVVGVPLLGWGKAFVFGEFIKQFVNSVCIIIALSAVLNMVSMLLRSMTGGILVNLLVVFTGIFLFSMLHSMPFSGIKKDIVDVVVKCNFIGQSTLIVAENSTSFLLWVTISTIVTTLFATVFGAYLFEKLDLK